MQDQELKSGGHVHYPMLKHGDRSNVHKTDTPVRIGNVVGGGSAMGTSIGFASDVIKQISVAVRYSQEHNNTQ